MSAPEPRRCARCYLQEAAHEPNDHAFVAQRPPRVDLQILWIPGGLAALILILISVSLFLMAVAIVLVVWLLVLHEQRDAAVAAEADLVFKLAGAEHRATVAERHARQAVGDYDAVVKRLGEVLDEHALCPASVEPIVVPQRLRPVPTQRDGGAS